MEINFRKHAALLPDESFTSQLRVPYVHSVISHDLTAGTLRFDGYFHDEDDGKPKLPRVAYMSGVGVVRILQKVVGPSTNTCGYQSDLLAVARTHAAAASSAPFEPIPEADPPSAHELELRAQERMKRDSDHEAAKKRPGYDDFDWMDICYTPTQIIDIRYEPVQP